MELVIMYLVAIAAVGIVGFMLVKKWTSRFPCSSSALC